jgi:outer membrane immunogenic protein
MMVSPAYDWSGFYFGAAAGGAFGKFDDNLVNGPAFAIPNVSTRYSKVDGALIGGVQKQFGTWVLGIEAAWNTNLININTDAVTNLAGGTTGFSNRVQDLVTFGARAGYAGWNNWLVYAEGGYAHARVAENFYIVATGALNSVDQASQNANGWYAGAGVDYMLYKGTGVDAIIGAEYQHIGLSEPFNPGLSNPNDAMVYGTKGIDLVRARLTFKFNPWASSTAVVAKY